MKKNHEIDRAAASLAWAERAEDEGDLSRTVQHLHEAIKHASAAIEMIDSSLPNPASREGYENWLRNEYGIAKASETEGDEEIRAMDDAWARDGIAIDTDEDEGNEVFVASVDGYYVAALRAEYKAQKAAAKDAPPASG